jgi:8-oxo-dGTP pyrophosphatase MutT (NUDIX family)
MAKQRHKLIPAGYVILKKKNKILLSRRFNTGFMDGYFGLPAGHTEENESFLQTTIREAYEEVGVKISAKDLKLVHLMHRCFGVHAIDFRIDAFYICEKWKGEAKNMEPNKCDDLRWVEINKLPKNTIPYIKIAIKNFINGKIFSEV